MNSKLLFGLQFTLSACGVGRLLHGVRARPPAAGRSSGFTKAIPIFPASPSASTWPSSHGHQFPLPCQPWPTVNASGSQSHSAQGRRRRKQEQGITLTWSDSADDYFFSSRIHGVKVTPTNGPSGEIKRLTVWPHGSFLFLLRIRYPSDSGPQLPSQHCPHRTQAKPAGQE